jgi:hypothetical protein
MWLYAGAVHHTVQDWPEYRIKAAIGYLLPFLIAAFLYSFAVQLYREAADKRVRGLIAQVLGLAVLAWIFEPHTGLKFLFWPSDTDILEAATRSSAHANPWLRGGFAWACVLAALAIFQFAAPYLRSGTQPGAFWQFAHKLTVSIIAANIGSYFAFGGVAAVLATAKLLFELDAPGEFIAKGAVLASSFSAPLILLALTPAEFEELPRTGSAKEVTSRAVSLFVRFIFIPLATVLSLMLAAYILTVLFRGGLVHARLGRGSVLYGTGIMLTALLALPDAAESRIARTFMRLWPWLLIPPTVLLFPSIFVRISDYGWTPLRYFVFLAGMWMALVMAVGFVRRYDMRIVPVLLTVLLALAAYGPWSLSEVTGRSQTNRLEALLTAKGLLAGGKWQDGQSLNWNGNEQQTIVTALDALDRTNQLHRLSPWFEGVADTPFAGTQWREAIKKKLNVGTYVRSLPPSRPYDRPLLQPYTGPLPPSTAFPRPLLPNAEPLPLPTTAADTYISFYTARPRVFLSLPSETYLCGPLELASSWIWGSGKQFNSPIGQMDMHMIGKMIFITHSDGRAEKFDLAALFSEVKESAKPASAGQANKSLTEAQARILDGKGNLKAKIAVTEAKFNITAGTVQTAEFYLILPADAMNSSAAEFAGCRLQM